MEQVAGDFFAQLYRGEYLFLSTAGGVALSGGLVWLLHYLYWTLDSSALSDRIVKLDQKIQLHEATLNALRRDIVDNPSPPAPPEEEIVPVSNRREECERLRQKLVQFNHRLTDLVDRKTEEEKVHSRRSRIIAFAVVCGAATAGALVWVGKKTLDLISKATPE